MTEVTSAPQPSMFALDEANSQRSTRSSADQSPDAQHATRTDSRSSSQQQQQPESEGQTSTSAQIDLARRVVPVQDCEDDVCSICLDGFSHDDPAQLTECRHAYHLQCIMQWAQRSCECPLCFKRLQMKEEGLNELLPFGEYRPPEHDTPSGIVMGMDSWEVDQLLARLAMSSGSARRSSRAARHAARAARQAQLGNDSGGVIESSSRIQHDESAAVPIDMHRGNDSRGTDYPSSWPPATHQRTSSRTGTGGGGNGESNAASDIRSTWTSRAKATLSHTTKELRSLWGRTAAILPEPQSSAQSRGSTHSSGAGPSSPAH